MAGHDGERTIRLLVLQALRRAEGPVSGAELARAAGVSRTAVWKHVQALRRQGYAIEGGRGLGYRLRTSPDLPTAEEVLPRLGARRLGRPYHFWHEVDSTNLVLRRLALEGAPEGTAVVADHQTQGRGRRGRAWTAPPGTAVHLSVLLRPQRPPAEAGRLTLLTAVAVRRAIARVTGLHTGIKWPNDLQVDGRKCCGILLELAAEQDGIDFVVAGIGVNVNQESFPAELAETATSLRLALGRTVSRAALVAALIDALEPVYEAWLTGADGPLLDEWRAACVHLGRPVTVHGPHGALTGVAADVAPDGALLLQVQGRDEPLRVHAGDVSLRPA